MRLVSRVSLVLSLLFVALCVGEVNAQCGLCGDGLAQRVVSRVTQPVVRTVAFVAQNRPRPVARLVTAVRSTSCVEAVVASDCNCGLTVPVLKARSTVYNCDTCGDVRVAPVRTVLRNMLTAVPRAVHNARAVRQANVISSSLFYVPVQSVSVEQVQVVAPSVNDSVTSISSSDLELCLI